MGRSKKGNKEENKEIIPPTNQEYSIVFSQRAKKELLALPDEVIIVIEQKIDGLAQNPRPEGCKKLQGSINEFRIRSGSYRVIYTVEDVVRIVTIIKVAHRKEVYR
jgi:mRNA interferase RelE/StbE